MKKCSSILIASSCVAGALLFFMFGYTSAPKVPVQAAATVSSLPEWDANTVYVGGDEIQYQSKSYRAKWWTQGENPSSAEVWENIGTQATTPAQQPAQAAKLEASTLPEGFKVVGYYPSWKPAQTHKLRYDILTHVIYAFAIPTAEGGLRPLENAETAQEIIQAAHANGVKVLLAVGGWSYQDTPLESVFVAATQTEEKRTAFADAIMEMCEQYGFDGIDMDWEHPRVDGSSGAQYQALMVTLGERLHADGKLLTSAVLSGATPDGNIYYDAAAHSDTVLNAVDWLNVMAYDGGDGERHSSYDFAAASASYWKQTRGLPADKVVLGVPFYGRPSWASYEDILQANPQAWNADISQINGMQAHYNGVATIQKKTQYARQNLGGIMIWEITQDTADSAHSLLSAIAQA